MTVEYEIEPIRGLPGNLPKDEHIVWQGSPDWQRFARSVFHLRLVVGWFVVVAALAFVSGGTGLVGALITLVVGVLGLAVLAALAWAGARSTVYTLTNKRMVLRFGASVPKCINLPLARIASADVRAAGGGHVDIVLAPADRFPLGWLQMWPHVRPWRVARPEPMLRAVPESFVAVLAAGLKAAESSAKAGAATGANRMEAAA